MSEIQKEPHSLTNTILFTTGGTVQAGNGIYLARAADDELLELCRKSLFAYILTARQLGKSSLMVRTVESLHQEGVRTVVIDLQAQGVQVTASEWYLGLLSIVESQLMLTVDVVEWWEKHNHLGITHRLTTFFEEIVLREVIQPLVIFVDEIDTTLSLNFTDDFFASIRYFYNSRAISEKFNRLSFVLIGVATPGDLVRDPQRTPFNIGQRVDLTDFTFEEALPLARGFNVPTEEANNVLKSVLKWTGGHPYLTQRLCQAISDKGSANLNDTEIDRIVGNTFFHDRSEQDSNLQFVRDMLTKRAPDITEVLSTYLKIWRERSPVKDEEQSLIKSHLKLCGVVRKEKLNLIVRNRIYRTVFDEDWIRKHLPVNWTKRLAKVGQVLVITLLVISAPVAIFAFIQRNDAMKARDAAMMAQKEADTERQKAEKARDEERTQKEYLKRIVAGNEEIWKEVIVANRSVSVNSSTSIAEQAAEIYKRQQKELEQERDKTRRLETDVKRVQDLANGNNNELQKIRKEFEKVKKDLEQCQKGYQIQKK